MGRTFAGQKRKKAYNISSALPPNYNCSQCLPDNSDDAATYFGCSVNLEQVMHGFRLSFDSQLGQKQVEYTVESNHNHNEHIPIILHLVDRHYEAVALQENCN